MPPNLSVQQGSHLANSPNQLYGPPFRLFENRVDVLNEVARQAPQQAAQYCQCFAVSGVDIKQYEMRVLALDSRGMVGLGAFSPFTVLAQHQPTG
jgi:hypothetical protein